MGGGRRDRMREPAPRSLRVRAAGLLPGADAVSIERPARLTLRDRNVRVGAVGTLARAPVGATEPLAQEPGAVGGSRRGLELPRGRPDGGEAAEKWIRARVVAREHRPGPRHRARSSAMCGGGGGSGVVRCDEAGRFHPPLGGLCSCFFWPAKMECAQTPPPWFTTRRRPMLRRLVNSVGAAAVRQARGPVNPAPVASRSVGGLMVVRPRRPRKTPNPHVGGDL